MVDRVHQLNRVSVLRQRSGRVTRTALFFFTGLVYAYLFAPIIIVVIASLNASGLTSFPPTGFTLAWYRELLHDGDILRALRVSVTIAVAAALLTITFATSAALGLSRLPAHWRKILQATFYLPVVVPGIVTGIALVFWFKRVGIPLGYPSVLIAHVVHAFPYAVAIILSSFSSLDPRLLEASQDLGATPWRTFWRVTFHLIRPGILGGALLAFTLSFDEFVVTFFVAGGGVITLPLEIYSRVRFLISPVVNAIAAVVLVLSMLLAVLVQVVLRIRSR